MSRELLASVITGFTFAAGGCVAVFAAIEDARTSRLPNRLTIPLVAIGLVGLTIAAAIAGDPTRLIGMFAGAAMLLLPWFAVHLVTPAGVGFGDVKLSAGLGLYLGWIDPLLSPIATVVAAVLFASSTVARRAARNEARPFGPALVAGAVLTAVGSLAISGRVPALSCAVVSGWGQPPAG